MENMNQTNRSTLYKFYVNMKKQKDNLKPFQRYLKIVFVFSSLEEPEFLRTAISPYQ